MTLLIDGGELIDLASMGGPADIKVIGYRETGFIVMTRGKAKATIDTTDMTIEEVSQALAVGIHQIEQQEAARGGNRAARRAAKAMARMH